MEKAFRSAPLAMLAQWIFTDLEEKDSVLGIPKANIQLPHPKLARTMFGHNVAAPLGVAAGPHTQLSQNIVSSWLCGARFIELKTVQILDEIAVSKPCIDAEDETYNCEWSQELKLEESFTEYLNGWVLIHALAHKMGMKDPGTHFRIPGCRSTSPICATPGLGWRRPSRSWPGSTPACGISIFLPNSPTTSPSPPCTAALRRRSSASPTTC